MSKSKEKKEKKLEPEIPEEETLKAEAEAENETEAVEEVPEEELLRNKVAELEKSNAELKDQMMRRQAELENYRKRLVRDKEDAIQFANESLIRDILGFIDNLDRALDAAKN